jgi:hypothetical protein
MAHTIVDTGNYVEFNKDGVKTHVLKPFDIDIEGGTVLIFKNDFESKRVTYSEITSPASANIAALRLAVIAYNNTETLSTGAATSAKQDLLLTELQLKADLTETQPVVSDSVISTLNSSTTNLAAGNSYTFTGTAEQTAHADLMLNLYADQPTLIRIQFSTDNGVSWDSTVTKRGSAGFNEFATLVKGKRHVRVIVSTDSLTTTIFRLQIQYGQFIQGRTALNGTLQIDNDSLVVRPSDRELEVSRGLVAGHISINKNGNNSDIDIGTEDIWATGGTFVPPTSATTVNFVSSSPADAAAGTGARTLTIQGLDGSYNQVTETLTMDGATQVPTALSYFIIHDVIVATAGTGGANAGTITTIWTGGGTPSGPSVAIGKGQSQFCIYQIPAGYTGFIEQFGGGTQGGTTLDIELFVKPFGGVYNFKGKMSLNSTGTSQDDRDFKYPIKVLEKSIVKLTGTAGANNTDVSGFFDLVIIINIG